MPPAETTPPPEHTPEPTPPDSLSLDRGYDWYATQWRTGPAFENNCGPACAVMVGKWVQESFPYSVEEARDAFFQEGVGWRRDTLFDFLFNYGISIEFVPEITQESILSYLNQGALVLPNLRMDGITYNPDKQSRMGKHTNGDVSHYLVIYGYQHLDGELYFQLHDPFTTDIDYDEAGEPLGKGRLFSAAETLHAMELDEAISFFAIFDRPPVERE